MNRQTLIGSVLPAILVILILLGVKILLEHLGVF